MDHFELPFRRSSPNPELQCLRPTTLKVRKDSHKIKKPPAAPPAVKVPALPLTRQRRSPIIIYAVSPKVIHADPSEFMSLVQRLTGASSSDASALSPQKKTSRDHAVSSSYARLATFNKAARALEDETMRKSNPIDLLDQLGKVWLTSVPSSLPSTSPDFNSLEMNQSDSLHQLISPALHGSNGFMEPTLLPSPSASLPIPSLPSPGAYWDLWNDQYQGF